MKGDNSSVQTSTAAPSECKNFALSERVRLLEKALSEAHLALDQETKRCRHLEMELKNDRKVCIDEAEEKVLISRSEFELLRLKEKAINVVKEGITIADAAHPDMPLIFINDGFCRMTGYSKVDVLGKNCRFLQGTDTEESTVQELRTAMKEGRGCVVELMNYRKSGDAFVNYLSLTPIHDRSTGTLTHYVGIQSDITELVKHKRAELAAKHEATEAKIATEAKSAFLARMSHEIRTPLNGMIAVGQLLADTELSPAQYDLVNTIRCSGEALLTLITDILDFSRIEANKLELAEAPFMLERVIDSAIDIAGMQAAQKRLHMAYRIEAGVPAHIVGDPQRLQQILLNILINAVKFTEQGQVLLEVWSETSVDTNHAIQFSVKDTGIGIAQGDLRKLFQSFSQVDAAPTRRQGGTGLGLTISQKLCEAMNGTMWAESQGHGFGSTFRWSILAKSCTPQWKPAGEGPISHSHSKNAPPPQHQLNKKLAGKKVLLVEPCGMVRSIIAVALKHWGCAVCVATSESDAIQHLHLSGNQDQILGKTEDFPTDTLSTAHLPAPDLSSYNQTGPYDCVIMDLTLGRLLTTLTSGCEVDEARRVVFIGWPGQNEPEDGGEEEQEENDGYSPAVSPTFVSASVAPLLPRALVNPDTHRRLLGYVVVSRPVRQARLMTALEEVIEMELHCEAVEKGARVEETDSQTTDEVVSLHSPRSSGKASSSTAQWHLLCAAQKKMTSGESSGSLTALDFATNRHKKLLLAEDNAINAKVALRILNKLGFENIVMANDGVEAVAAVERAGGLDAFFAILMDLHMPRMGGMEAVADIKRKWPTSKTKIVAVTADAFEDTRDKCAAVGFDGWLAKPFRVEEFAKLMNG